MVINALRGMHVCVPRNMVQAVGMYNTLLRSNDPGIVVECLNGYRLKEKAPADLLEFTVPFGVPEVIREGTDVTIVSYMFNEVMEKQSGYRWLDGKPRTITAKAPSSGLWK